MAKILVHLTHGPEHPTKAALAFLVAKSAIDEGHTVSLFLAGDAVQLMRQEVLDNLAGLGTGKLRESYDAVQAGGGKIYVSGMSAKARGLDIENKPIQAVMPNVLVQLAVDSDRMFSY